MQRRQRKEGGPETKIKRKSKEQLAAVEEVAYLVRLDAAEIGHRQT